MNDVFIYLNGENGKRLLRNPRTPSGRVQGTHQ